VHEPNFGSGRQSVKRASERKEKWAAHGFQPNSDSTQVLVPFFIVFSVFNLLFKFKLQT
jgi:hypothetical protein